MLRARLEADEPCVDVAIAPGGARAYLLALLHGFLQRPLVVITPDQAAADQLAQGLRLFLGRASGEGGLDPVICVPDLDWTPYEGLSPDRLTIMARLAALFRLQHGVPAPSPLAVVLAAPTLRKKVLPRAAMDAHTDLIARGDQLDREQQLERLIAAGYNRVPLVEEPGTFAVRGGVIDIFSPLYPQPARIEQWGEEVDNIRFFSPADQRSAESVDEIFVVPVREELRAEGTVAAARESLIARADAEEVPSAILKSLLSDLTAGFNFFGIETLLPAFHSRLEDLFDYLPAEALLCVVDEEACLTALEQASAAVGAAYERRSTGQEVRFEPAAQYLDSARLVARLQGERRLRLGGIGLGGGEPLHFASESHEGLVQELRARRGEGESLGPLTARVSGWLEQGYRVALVVPSKSRAERIAALIQGAGFEVVRRGSGIHLEGPGRDGLEPGVLNLCGGRLAAGFEVAVHRLAVVSAEQALGRWARRRPRRVGVEGVFQATLSDLLVGDYLVHSDHGIARYGGLVRLAVGGLDQDFLLLQFHGKDKLYLPVYRLDRVQRYVGGEIRSVRLDKLGGSSWQKIKDRVRESVRKLAMDLLALHAARETVGGFQFPAHDDYFAQFEADFPFEETEDQARAIDEVLEDMRRPRCMDRLVCGDVGFGKTEVAMRAAFLAVLGGRQVAVLCPTTVLVEQHLRVFRRRFEAYPSRVESLSRFVSRQRQRDILADASLGKVDVLVGTHRLLSKDVELPNLGLLIIDEEHRFGVRHKERLRELKTEVDVLTLTATPIPRTLNMAIGGVKDLSIIATPPVDRQAVRTYVARRGDDVVRGAILLELQRGGQVFFVHNRVRSLGEVHAWLSELVPEARMVVAHGQMAAEQVESAMLKFVRGEANLLLCTSIVESGLDIPRANTLIVDRAHTFGLASLYQLRGRVGRSDKRAHAHLLIPDPRTLSADARQRLEVIKRFTELGAGFQVASYDMEIRGSGDMLGAEQTGHIAAVGFETYAELLDETVRELKGEPLEASLEPELELGVEAFLPEDYVGETGQRLVFYKRLSMATEPADVLQISDEMEDRFGPAPPQALALMQVMAIKVLARLVGAERVERVEACVFISLAEESRVSPEAMALLLQEPRSPWRVLPDLRLAHHLSAAEAKQPLPAVRSALNALFAGATRQTR